MSLIQHDEDYDTLRAAADAPALVRLAQADPHLLEDAFLARVLGWYAGMALAQAAGVSPSTVSRALDESELVGSDTRLLVHAAADRLGYKRRTIRRPESRSIMTIMAF